MEELNDFAKQVNELIESCDEEMQALKALCDSLAETNKKFKNLTISKTVINDFSESVDNIALQFLGLYETIDAEQSAVLKAESENTEEATIMRQMFVDLIVAKGEFCKEWCLYGAYYVFTQMDDGMDPEDKSFIDEVDRLNRLMSYIITEMDYSEEE